MKTKNTLALAVSVASLLAFAEAGSVAEARAPVSATAYVQRGHGQVKKFQEGIHARWAVVARRFDKLSPAARKRLERIDRMLERLSERVERTTGAVKRSLLRKISWLTRSGERLASGRK